MAQSSYSAQSSMRSFNAAQILVTEPLDKVILYHFLPEFLPICITRSITILNFFILSYYLSPLDATVIFFAQFFFVFIFGSITEAFASQTYFYVQRYLHEQQFTAASTHLTYSIAIRTIFSIILTALFTPFADKLLMIFTNYDTYSPYFRLFCLTSLLNSSLAPEVKYALEADCKHAQLLWRSIAISLLFTMSITFYFFFNISTATPFSVLIFTILQIIALSVPQVYLIASLSSHIYFLNSRHQSLFFNIKLLFPVRWMLISLILIKFFEGLLYTVSRPMMNAMLLLLMISRQNSSPEMDNLLAIYSGSYIVLSEFSQTFTDSFSSLAFHFFSANFNNQRLDRIDVFLTKKLWKIALACVIFALLLFLSTNFLVKIYVSQMTEALQQVEILVGVFANLRNSTLTGVFSVFYGFSLGLSRSRNSNTQYLLAGFSLISDIIFILISAFFGENYDIMECLIFSNIIKGVCGGICLLWDAKILKNEIREGLQRDDEEEMDVQQMNDEGLDKVGEIGESKLLDNTNQLSLTNNEFSTKIENSDFLAGIRSSQISGGGFGVNEGVFIK